MARAFLRLTALLVVGFLSFLSLFGVIFVVTIDDPNHPLSDDARVEYREMWLASGLIGALFFGVTGFLFKKRSVSPVLKWAANGGLLGAVIAVVIAVWHSSQVWAGNSGQVRFLHMVFTFPSATAIGCIAGAFAYRMRHRRDDGS